MNTENKIHPTPFLLTAFTLIVVISSLRACTPTIEAAIELDRSTPVVSPQQLVTNSSKLLNPMIEIGNQSGVAGYHAAVFGTGFGSIPGSVTVLGQAAQIITWEANFVEVVVPDAPVGSGDLMLTTADAQTITHPFTVYTINPNFQQTTDKFTNIAFNKPAVLTGLESELCFAQPANNSLAAELFLTNFVCGYQGVNNVGEAIFQADSSLGKSSTIALDLETDLAGELWFQFFIDSTWYPNDPGPLPVAYQIQVSADSTDGQNGTWLTVQTTNNNNRASRTHRVTVPTGSYHWIRLLVTDAFSDGSEPAGKEFRLREIRVYQPNSTINRPDTFALYGDSLTASAFDAINASGFAQRVKTKRGGDDDLVFFTYGLSGKNSTGFLDDSDSDSDIYDAFELDGAQTNIRFWGIGIGINDTNDGAAGLAQESSNVSQYDERLDAIVSQIIANGGVPIVARIPDTDENNGGFGDLPAKRKVLADIDRIAAAYRLIPGPDLYTPYRRNIETNNGSWLGGDGTHHTEAGESMLIDLWAGAFVNGLVLDSQSTTTPIPTSTLASTPTVTPAATSVISLTPAPTSTLVSSQLEFVFLPMASQYSLSGMTTENRQETP